MDGQEKKAVEGPAAGEKAAGTAPPAWARAEHAARESYGRLLAILAAPTGDIELAEDALGDAFEKALRTWPESGVPANPEAWLLTVARNRQRDSFKSAARRTTISLQNNGRGKAASLPAGMNPDAIPDKRLALLFVCAHPAVAPSIRTPLMLQTVLGFEARQIAEAFAVPVSTMAQRLVRAKRRIRDARIPFVVPDRTQMPGRLSSVLEAIYGVYAIELWLVSGTTTRDCLAADAHYLAITLAELLGDEPEAFGLAALISYSLSRADARGSSSGFIPLEEQDTGTWNRGFIRLGEKCLHRAHALDRIGRFQFEAAIQSVHCARAVTGSTDWSALRKLYAALVSISPTLGSRVAFAATIGRTEGPEAGLTALDQISDDAVQLFQPAWATRAHLLATAGRANEAQRAYEKAISLTTASSIREYLEKRRSAATR